MEISSEQARRAFLCLFFGAQLLAIGVGRYTETKYFNWVPYDELSNYEIVVTLPTGPLPAAAVAERYRKPATGRENRDIDNLLSLIRQYEMTYGAQDGARVEVNYLTNGYRHYNWTWPPTGFPSGGSSASGH